MNTMIFTRLIFKKDSLLPFVYSKKRCSTSPKGSKWKSVVGLEVHAKITTNSKLFSGAPNTFTSAANTSVALFDASIPGKLPRLNRKCVESGIKTALALSCKLNSISMFDRKHYFYADSPAGFQITQQRLPLAVDGEITFYVTNVKKPYKKVSKIHQIQLEQDSGKSLHFPETSTSLVDLNRAGVPLMELVFEPDLCDGEEAAALVKELVLILTRLNTCSCEMSQGALRVDANISIHKEGEPFGTRTEVKNVASVRGLARAIDYEIERQIKLVESGGKVTNETRAWDSIKRETIVMRDKEVQKDYRFMPEPNLPFLNLNDPKHGLNVDNIKNNLPELPEETRALLKNFNLEIYKAETILRHHVLLDLFMYAMKKYSINQAQMISTLLSSTVINACRVQNIDVDECPLSRDQFAEIIEMLIKQDINSILAIEVIKKIIINPNQSVLSVVETNNLRQINDEAEITKFCQEVFVEHPKKVRRYKRGHQKDFNKLVHEVLVKSDNRANMNLIKDIINKLILI